MPLEVVLLECDSCGAELAPAKSEAVGAECPICGKKFSEEEVLKRKLAKTAQKLRKKVKERVKSGIKEKYASFVDGNLKLKKVNGGIEKAGMINGINQVDVYDEAGIQLTSFRNPKFANVMKINEIEKINDKVELTVNARILG